MSDKDAESTKPDGQPARPTRLSVGFDGSDSSRAAVEWAGDEAARRGAQLRIVSAYHLPLVGDATYAWTPTEAYRGLLEGTEEGMRDIADAQRAAHPGLLVTTDPTAGPAGSSLIEDGGPSDLVVVGASTHTRLAGWLFGSTAHYLVRESRSPVVVVPVGTIPGPPDRVVVGVDGSPASTDALIWAGEQADRHGVPVSIVHAWAYPYRPVDPPSIQARDLMRIDAACVLEVAVAVARERFAAEVRPELVEGGPAASLIGTVHDGDLLVLGSRGRGALASTVFGSTVNSVLESSAVPVVIVRPTPSG
jgi:nucleotide-binding universal stress UspA family protein